MQKQIFSLLLMLSVIMPECVAQKNVLHEETDTSGYVPMFGRNRSVYVHPLIKIGAVIPVFDDGAEVALHSTSLSFEVRTKAKICSWNALVLDFGYRCDRLVIPSKKNMLIPGFGGDYKRERFSLHQLSFSLCDRVNFGRRGNILGIYTDVGFYGDYTMRAMHLMVTEHYDSGSPVAGHVKVKVKENQIPFVNNLNYGLTCRFGWEWGSFYAMYRLSEFIVDHPPISEYPDLPRIIAGVEMYGIFD